MNLHTLTATVISESSIAIAEEAAVRIRTVLDALYPDDNILVSVDVADEQLNLQRYFARVQYKDNNLGSWDTVYKSAIIEAPSIFSVDNVYEALGVKGEVGLQLLTISKL